MSRSSDDPYASAFQAAGQDPYARPGSTRGASAVSRQAVWDRLAREHPRKFRRAVRYLQWLDRMYARYESKV